MLSLHPLLFHSEKTFDAIYHLKGKLSSFLQLLAVDIQKALFYWRTEMKQDIKLITHVLFEEVAALELD